MELYYPDAEQRLIPPGSNDPPIIPIGIIWHVDAGNNPSLYNYFKNLSGGIESHMHFPKANKPEQYRDFGHEADANRFANSFVINGKTYGFISCETQGFGAGEWNAYQLTEMKKFSLWAHRNLHIPLSRCVSPFSPGHGYHTMWGAPSEWTPVAKSCPGPDRIRQFNNVLIPWMSTVINTPIPGGSMTTSEMDALIQRLLNTVIRADGLTVRSALAMADFAGDQLADAAKLQQNVETLKSGMAELLGKHL